MLIQLKRLNDWNFSWIFYYFPPISFTTIKYWVPLLEVSLCNLVEGNKVLVPCYGLRFPRLRSSAMSLS